MVSTLWVTSSVRAPVLAAAQAASVPGMTTPYHDDIVFVQFWPCWLRMLSMCQCVGDPSLDLLAQQPMMFQTSRHVDSQVFNTGQEVPNASLAMPWAETKSGDLEFSSLSNFSSSRFNFNLKWHICLGVIEKSETMTILYCAIQSPYMDLDDEHTQQW